MGLLGECVSPPISPPLDTMVSPLISPSSPSSPPYSSTPEFQNCSRQNSRTRTSMPISFRQGQRCFVLETPTLQVSFSLFSCWVICTYLLDVPDFESVEILLPFLMNSSSCLVGVRKIPFLALGTDTNCFLKVYQLKRKMLLLQDLLEKMIS